MKTKELKQELESLPKEQLEARAQELLKEIYNIKIEQKMQQQVAKPHLIREKKKTRARILTLLNRPQQQQQAQKAEVIEEPKAEKKVAKKAKEKSEPKVVKKAKKKVEQKGEKDGK